MFGETFFGSSCSPSANDYIKVTVTLTRIRGKNQCSLQMQLEKVPRKDVEKILGHIIQYSSKAKCYISELIARRLFDYF